MFNYQEHSARQQRLKNALVALRYNSVKDFIGQKMIESCDALVNIQLDLLQKLSGLSTDDVDTITISNLYKLNYANQQEYLRRALGVELQCAHLPDYVDDHFKTSIASVTDTTTSDSVPNTLEEATGSACEGMLVGPKWPRVYLEDLTLPPVDSVTKHLGVEEASSDRRQGGVFLGLPDAAVTVKQLMINGASLSTVLDSMFSLPSLDDSIFSFTLPASASSTSSKTQPSRLMQSSLVQDSSKSIEKQRIAEIRAKRRSERTKEEKVENRRLSNGIYSQASRAKRKKDKQLYLEKISVSARASELIETEEQHLKRLEEHVEQLRQIPPSNRTAEQQHEFRSFSVQITKIREKIQTVGPDQPVLKEALSLFSDCLLKAHQESASSVGCSVTARIAEIRAKKPSDRTPEEIVECRRLSNRLSSRIHREKHNEEMRKIKEEVALLEVLEGATSVPVVSAPQTSGFEEASFDRGQRVDLLDSMYLTGTPSCSTVFDPHEFISTVSTNSSRQTTGSLAMDTTATVSEKMCATDTTVSLTTQVSSANVHGFFSNLGSKPLLGLSAPDMPAEAENEKQIRWLGLGSI